MRKQYIIDFQGTATIYAYSEDEAVEMLHNEDWEDLDIDFVSVDEDDDEEDE